MEDELTSTKKHSYVNFIAHEYSQRYQHIELIILSIASFTIPIFFAQPQLLIGSIINAMLFRGALTTKFSKIVPIIFLPSIGAFVGSMLFGGFTPYIVYFMPMIWASNSLYVLAAKYVDFQFKKHHGFNVLAASLLKSGLLFGSAIIMVRFFALPEMFLVAMGTMQLYTALIGGMSALAITTIEKKIWKQ